jgi:hypothetical protein
LPGREGILREVGIDLSEIFKRAHGLKIVWFCLIGKVFSGKFFPKYSKETTEEKKCVLPDWEGIFRIVSLKYAKEPTDEIFFLPSREGILGKVSLKYSK